MSLGVTVETLDGTLSRSMTVGSLIVGAAAGAGAAGAAAGAGPGRTGRTGRTVTGAGVRVVWVVAAIGAGAITRISGSGAGTTSWAVARSCAISAPSATVPSNQRDRGVNPRQHRPSPLDAVARPAPRASRAMTRRPQRYAYPTLSPGRILKRDGAFCPGLFLQIDQEDLANQG